MLDLTFVMYASNSGYFGGVYVVPWVASVCRPPIFLQNNSDVNALWRRY